MAQWEYQNMTYPVLLLPPHLYPSLATSPFHPSFSSPGFFNREHICCRNSSEGRVSPPWHSWLSRQTDGQASGLTPRPGGPTGTQIYNWLNLTPRRLNSPASLNHKTTGITWLSVSLSWGLPLPHRRQVTSQKCCFPGTNTRMIFDNRQFFMLGKSCINNMSQEQTAECTRAQILLLLHVL